MTVFRWLTAVTFAAIACIQFSGAALAKDSWTVRKEVVRGKTIDLQTMYNINARTCIAQKVPPRPQVKKAPKLGKIAVKNGTTNPRQCPSETINANFTVYNAGNQVGRDRFTVHYVSTESKHVFRVRFIVDVK